MDIIISNLAKKSNEHNLPTNTAMYCHTQKCNSTDFAHKKVLSISEAAISIGVTNEVMQDFISCGDVIAVGSKKNMIKLCELNKFVEEPYDISFQANQNPQSDKLFRDCFLEYVESLNGGVSNRTFGNHISMIPHILDGLGKYKMREINKTILKKFINNLTLKKYTKKKNGTPDTYYSQSMINKIFDLLHGFIIEVSDEEGSQLLKIDFMAKIKKPVSNKHSSEKEQVFTDQEIKKIFSAIKTNKMISCWIHILADTGVRPSEALALKFSDINFENGTINIFRTLSKTADYDVQEHKRISHFLPFIKDLKNDKQNKKIDYQRRTLKVSQQTLKVLKRWEEYIKSNKALLALKCAHNTEEFLFNGFHGQLCLYEDYKQIYQRLLNSKELNGNTMNPYRYRHTVCTDLLRHGVDIKTVQLILGDNTPDMVLKVYSNMNKDDVLKGSQIRADRMDEMLRIVPN